MEQHRWSRGFTEAGSRRVYKEPASPNKITFTLTTKNQTNKPSKLQHFATHKTNKQNNQNVQGYHCKYLTWDLPHCGPPYNRMMTGTKTDQPPIPKKKIKSNHHTGSLRRPGPCCCCFSSVLRIRKHLRISIIRRKLILRRQLPKLRIRIWLIWPRLRWLRQRLPIQQLLLRQVSDLRSSYYTANAWIPWDSSTQCSATNSVTSRHGPSNGDTLQRYRREAQS